MKQMLNLLRAERIGVKECQTTLYQKVNNKDTVILTVHGEPQMVMVDYEEMVDLLETLANAKEGRAGRHAHAN